MWMSFFPTSKGTTQTLEQNCWCTVGSRAIVANLWNATSNLKPIGFTTILLFKLNNRLVERLLELYIIISLTVNIQCCIRKILDSVTEATRDFSDDRRNSVQKLENRNGSNVKKTRESLFEENSVTRHMIPVTSHMELVRQKRSMC
jgi:hypothetical protein